MQTLLSLTNSDCVYIADDTISVSTVAMDGASQTNSGRGSTADVPEGLVMIEKSTLIKLQSEINTLKVLHPPSSLLLTTLTNSFHKTAVFIRFGKNGFVE